MSLRRRATPVMLAAVLAALVLLTLAGQARAADASSAFGTAGRWITYPDGRVFLPHGVNVITTRAPFYPAFFTDADARLLAAEGFTSVRIGFEPEALEPTLGHFDDQYLQRFAELVRLLGRYGISVLFVLNQDLYTHQCGGDGFPDWAVLSHPVGTNERTFPFGALADQECSQAWKYFWADAKAPDDRGLQEHFLEWWKRAARLVRGENNLLGFDVINEPSSTGDRGLSSLYKRLIPTIRGQDSEHNIFLEPTVSLGVVRQDTVDDPGHTPAVFPDFGVGNVGYTYHYYCAVLFVDFVVRPPAYPDNQAACADDEKSTFKVNDDYGRARNYALLLGEFGATDDTQLIDRQVDAAGKVFLPWQWYAYQSELDASGPKQQGFKIDESKPASESNAKQFKLDSLVVPYPLAVAGTPKSWEFDRKSRAATLTYSTTGPQGKTLPVSAHTVLFVPARKYPEGYTATVDGGRVVSGPGSPWLEVANDRGAKEATIRLKPLAGERTKTPLEADRCGYRQQPCGRRASKTCTSRRLFVIHLVDRRGRPLRSARVTVDGRPIAVSAHGRMLRAKIDLRGRPGGRVRVKVRGKRLDGRAYAETRSYVTCRAGSRRLQKP